MFANDPRDYPRSNQRHGHADEPYYDAGQSWQQQGQHAAQPGAGPAGRPRSAAAGCPTWPAAAQGQEGWQTAGQEAPLHAEAGTGRRRRGRPAGRDRGPEGPAGRGRAEGRREPRALRARQRRDGKRPPPQQGRAGQGAQVRHRGLCRVAAAGLRQPGNGAHRRDPSVDSIREGVQATLRQLQQALERNKVQVVDPLGQRFDPNTQQAISMQPNPEVAANHVAPCCRKAI